MYVFIQTTNQFDSSLTLLVFAFRTAVEGSSRSLLHVLSDISDMSEIEQ